ncbi:MAG: archaetidylserine decarboxylase [Methylohalobius sp.]
MKAILFAWLQYLLPQHTLSRLVGKIARCRIGWLKDALILWFARCYQVDLTEAEIENPKAYPCLDAFFTRALKPGARPLPQDPEFIVCPADGTISQLGSLTGEWLIQAKGRDYSAAALLGDAALAEPFVDGEFATIYLSPRDYHRVHMPYPGTLKEMLHIPGRLFSVSESTAEEVENLFARNERVVCLFDTDLGPMAIVLVGALLVAGIETVWHGLVTPPSGRQIRRWHYDGMRLARGEELGRFHLGSTVILLFPPARLSWCAQAGQGIRLGQALGRKLPAG